MYKSIVMLQGGIQMQLINTLFTELEDKSENAVSEIRQWSGA